MSSPLRVYEYEKCDTCRNALKFLEEQEAAFDRIPIIERPPTAAELKRMLGYLKKRGGDFKKLFNTSGQVYRELKVGEKIKEGMTEEDAIRLLASHGKLIKRPFALSASDGTVGFRPEEWKALLKTLR